MLTPSSSNGGVALGGFEQIEIGLLRRPGGRSGDVRAAEAADQFHVGLGVFEPFRALGIVVNDPFGEADRTVDLQAVIADPLGQVFAAAAVHFVAAQIAHPGLDGVITGLGGQVDLIGHAQLLPAHGAHVEAVAQRFGHGNFGVRSEQRLGRTGSGSQA